MTQIFPQPLSDAEYDRAKKKAIQQEKRLSASKLLFVRSLTSLHNSLLEKKCSTPVIRILQPQNSQDAQHLTQRLVEPDFFVTQKYLQEAQGIHSKHSSSSVICCNFDGDSDFCQDLDIQEQNEKPRKLSESTAAPESISDDQKHGEDDLPQKFELIDSEEAEEKLSQEIIEQLNSQDLEIARIRSALADNDRYKTIKKKKYTMQYRKEKNKTTTLKFEGELEIEIKNLFKLLNETQIQPLWFPHCRKADLIHSFNMNKKMIRNEVTTPGLMSDRESIMLSLFADRLQSRGCIYQLAKSVQHLEEIHGFPIPKITKGKVSMEVEYCAFQIEPTSRKTAIIRNIFNFSPKVKFVPQWLLNIINRHFGKLLFERMIKYSLSLKGTKIEKKLATLEEGQFYETMNKKLLSYYERKGW